MNITEILKGPFKGEFSNSKMTIKESSIINAILACVFAMVFIINIKVFTGNGLSIIRGISGLRMLGEIVNGMLIRVIIISVLNFIAMAFAFSGIIYLIAKKIFKMNITFEEVLSTCTYANIIPTAIMLTGVLFTLFSVVLGMFILCVQILVLIILTYEGISSLIIAGKSKVIYSIAITYIINVVLFVAANYLIIKSLIEYKMRNLFGGL